MPYIPQTRREHLDKFLYGLEPETAGDLAYVVYRLMLRYWQKKPDYARWAKLRGVVNDQVDEFRRRVINDYEGRKRQENGDVQ